MVNLYLFLSIYPLYHEEIQENLCQFQWILRLNMTDDVLKYINFIPALFRFPVTFNTCT